MEADVDAIRAEKCRFDTKKIKEVSVMRNRKLNNRTPSFSLADQKSVRQSFALALLTGT